MDNRLRTELASLPSPSERTTRLWDSIINVVIVHLGGRPACLVESADYSSDERRWVRDWRLIQRLAVDVLRLHITPDELGHPDYPRYIVSSKKMQRPPTSHQALGRLLGMTWTGQFHDLQNAEVEHDHIYDTDHQSVHTGRSRVIDRSTPTGHSEDVQAVAASVGPAHGVFWRIRVPCQGRS